MNAIVKECGELLKQMKEQKKEAEMQPEKEKMICDDMIAQYQAVMLRMEQIFMKQDIRKYLQIRRARFAVCEELEEIVPFDILYLWLVENVCSLEAI